MIRSGTDIAAPADHVVVALPQWATWRLWGVKAKVLMARYVDFSAVRVLGLLVRCSLAQRMGRDSHRLVLLVLQGQEYTALQLIAAAIAKAAGQLG